MTRKHYKSIASIIENQLLLSDTKNEQLGIERLARELSDQFSFWNDRFDPDRFLIACGIKP